jgi:hypothetical protein
MKTITETEATRNTVLDEPIKRDSELKRWLVDYVGINSEEYVHDNEITVQMIIDTMAKEFPEFLMAVAEENWIRGYSQALHDVEEGRKLLDKDKEQISDEQWIDEYNKHHETVEE